MALVLLFTIALCCAPCAGAGAFGPLRAPTLSLALRRVHRAASEHAATFSSVRAVKFALAFEPNAELPADTVAFLRDAEQTRAALALNCRAAAADDECVVSYWDDEYNACFVSRVCKAYQRRVRHECTAAALDRALGQAFLLQLEQAPSTTLAERQCAVGAVTAVGFLGHYANGTCSQIDIGESDACRARFDAHPSAHHAPWFAAVRELVAPQN